MPAAATRQHLSEDFRRAGLDDAAIFADDLPPRSSRIPINVTYTRYDDGVASSRIIARCEGCGRWFEWYE